LFEVNVLRSHEWREVFAGWPTDGSSPRIFAIRQRMQRCTPNGSPFCRGVELFERTTTGRHDQRSEIAAAEPGTGEETAAYAIAAGSNGLLGGAFLRDFASWFGELHFSESYT
jgi:hypothetical protein